jgi:8-oxo-dGTP diphosphatase
VKPNDIDESPPPGPVPNVDVRIVLFTVCQGKLWIALNERSHCYCLPHGRPQPDESLDATAARILANQLRIQEQYIEQLYSLSGTDDGEWTVSVTYLGLALSGPAGLPEIAGRWFDAGAIPQTNAADSNITDYGLLRLRAKLGYTTVAFHLLPPSFTLSELQQVYESVLDRQLDKRNFRRRIHAAGILEPTGVSRREGSHRPAHLYRSRAAHDTETFLTPGWSSSTESETTDT